MKINSNRIKRSAKIDRLAFPVRTDYEEYFISSGIVSEPSELWSNPEYVSIVHRHWHGEGRNGCIFALLAARRAEELGWQDLSFVQTIEELKDSDFVNEVNDSILKAIDNPQCEVLSLLFSRITNTKDLIQLIHLLTEVDSIILTDEIVVDEYVAVSLRVPVESEEVLSWLMAFAPLDYFPKTRQSPILEIAIRVKQKPEVIFHRLTQDREAAHLADLPLDYNSRIMEKSWTNTFKRTRMILGEEPNLMSAAKTTFVLPRSNWKTD